MSLRVLAITQIFPNAEAPYSAQFNRQQFAALAKLCQLQVWGILPTFPYEQKLRNLAAKSAPVETMEAKKVPRHDNQFGVDASYLKVLHVPGMLRGAAGPLYALSLLPRLWPVRDSFDVLLAAWAYPDGAAVVALSRLLHKPCVVKLHGSDMNVVARLPGPNKQLRMILPKADAVVAVSEPLKQAAIDLGVTPERVSVIRNGVDSELFFPRDRLAARKVLKLSPDRKLLLYIGHLKPIKGVADLLVGAEELFTKSSDIDLAIVGDGELREQVRNLQTKWPTRLFAPGAVDHSWVATWLAACDHLVLASHAEGTPNVVLEALASGRRVVATNVGGVPDIVSSERLGILVPPQNPSALSEALLRAAQTFYEPEQIVLAAQSSSWNQSASKLHDLLKHVCNQ